MRGYHLSGIVAVIRTILLLLIDCRRHITLMYFAEQQSVGCSRQLEVSDTYKHVMGRCYALTALITFFH